MKSIVLLKTKSGEANAVLERLKRLSVVSECCVPFGRYDAAAVVEGETLEELWQIVRVELSRVRGVEECFPCMVDEAHSLRHPPEHLMELAMYSD